MKEKLVFSKSINYVQFKLKNILNQVSQKDIDKVKKIFFDSDRIFVYGAGRSGLVAKAFAIRLFHLGFQTFVIGETISAPVQIGDMVIIVSGSGETIPASFTSIGGSSGPSWAGSGVGVGSPGSGVGVGSGDGAGPAQLVIKGIDIAAIVINATTSISLSRYAFFIRTNLPFLDSDVLCFPNFTFLSRYLLLGL